MRKISRKSFIKKSFVLLLFSIVPSSLLPAQKKKKPLKSTGKKKPAKGVMELEFKIGQSRMWSSKANKKTLMERKVVTNRKPHKSDSFLTEKHLVVKAVDKNGKVIHSFNQLDPRVVHVDHFLAGKASGKVENSNYLLELESSLLMNLPNNPAIRYVKVYRPKWDGKEFKLNPVTTIKVPRRNLNLASKSFEKKTLKSDTANPKVENIIFSGNSKDKVDIVLIGDGYTEAQMDLWKSDAQKLTDQLFEKEPFKSYPKYFNVHRIDLASPEEGAGWTNPWSKKNAYGAYYNCSNIPRLLWLDTSHANRMINTVLNSDQQDIKLVMVNDKRYGGGGGSFATASARSSSALSIMLHEIGHSFGGFADEYDYGSCGGSSYEPSAANVTIESDPGKVKWKHIKDTGLFEGAQYCKKGVYRPYENSIMRSLSGQWGQLHADIFRERIEKMGVKETKWG